MTARRKERRVLVLAPFPPRLDATHGGGRAVAQLVLAYARSSRVALLALRAHGEPGVDEAVAAACERVDLIDHIAIGRSPQVAWRERARFASLVRGYPLWAASASNVAFRLRLAALCEEWRPDVVQAELGVMGGYLPLVPRPALRVLVEHDPGVRRTGAPWSQATWRRFSRDVGSAADAVVVFSEEDARAERNVLPPGTVLEQIPLPWLVPVQPLDAVGAEPPTVLFVGNFRHAPNLAAARRLAGLLPALQRQRPGVSVALVGPAGPTDLARTGVTVTGRVEDVGPWLAAAAVVAVPLSEGGGVRVKVVEALAAGKAVVGTPLAFEGLDVVNGRQALIEEDDAALVAAISGLLADPEQRRSLGAAARGWAERLPDPATVGDCYEQLWDRLAEERR